MGIIKKFKSFRLFEKFAGSTIKSDLTSNTFEVTEDIIVYKIRFKAEYIHNGTDILFALFPKKKRIPKEVQIPIDWIVENSMGFAIVQDSTTLNSLGYGWEQSIKNVKINGNDTLDLNKVVTHLDEIEIYKKYSGRKLGKILLDFIMNNLKIDYIYLQATPDSIKYWINVMHCEKTGYFHTDTDEESHPLLKYVS
jgi:ribosomal protein S18 acetylase RimI-like enzyme